MKRYKNPHLKALYSGQFAFYMAGLIMFILSLLLLVYGALATPGRMKEQCTYEEAEKHDGNLAGQVVTFDVTAEPVEVGYYGKDSHYFLMTNGDRYILSVMDPDDYDEVIEGLKKDDTYKFEGVTQYIVDKDERTEVAHKISNEIGENVTSDNLEDTVGEMVVEFVPFTYPSIMFACYGVNVILGGILGVIGLIMLLGFSYELRRARRFFSLSGITADDVDRELSESDAKFFPYAKVGITKNLLIGLRASDKYDDQIALKFDEIRNVYGRRLSATTGIKENFMLYADATDGKTYVISENVEPIFTASSDFIGDSIYEINKVLSKKAPGIRLEPADTRYEVFRYPFYVTLESGGFDEGKDAYAHVKDYCEDEFNIFEHCVSLSEFQPAEALFNVETKVLPDGQVEIKLGYFAQYEDRVRSSADEFLRAQLDKAASNHFDPDDYGNVVFSKDAKYSYSDDEDEDE